MGHPSLTLQEHHYPPPQQQQGWSPLAPNFPFPSPHAEDLSTQHHLQSQHRRYMDEMQRQQRRQSERVTTSPHLLLGDTTHHFPSTLPHHQAQQRRLGVRRRTPPTPGGSIHPHQPQPPILVNGPMQDPTTRGVVNGAMGGMMGETTAMESGIERDGTSTEEMYGLSAAAGVGSGQVPRRARLASEDSQHQQQQQQGGQGMSTGASLGHSLDGSPSWNSAMTSMELSQQLDHLYRYQAQRAGSQEELVVQQEDQQGQERQGPPRRPDSSLAHNNSLSMTDGALPGPQRHSPMEDMTRVGSRQYSLELRRQQEEQLRRLQQQHQQQQYMELGAAEVEGLYRPHQAPHPYMDLDLSGAGPGAGDGDRYGQHHHGLHMSAGEAVDGVYRPVGEGDGMSMSTGAGAGTTNGARAGSGEESRLLQGQEVGVGTTTGNGSNGGHRSHPPHHPAHHHPTHHHQQHQHYYPHPQQVYELDMGDGYGHPHPHHLAGMEQQLVNVSGYQGMTDGVGVVGGHHPIPMGLGVDGENEMIKFEPGLE